MSGKIAQQGTGAPSHCWHCFKQLQRVTGKPGMFYFELVRDPAGVDHRVHQQCLERAVADANKAIT